MKKNYTRRVVLSLFFVATGLSFLDRQVLSMTIIKIQAEFKFSNVKYGIINTSFLISYALIFNIGGRLMDKLGSKMGMAISLCVWSIASFLHGIMDSLYLLVAFRFLLGIGEGGCLPGAAKTVYDWLDEKKRALANGIAIGGSAIGAVIALPIIILISKPFGWRWSFAILGFIGMIWVIALVYFPWVKNSRANKKQHIVPLTAIPFLTTLKNKVALIRFLPDPVKCFIIFWVPKYLHEVRNISFERIGKLFRIPFLALGLSNIIGGWFSDKLLKNNFAINRARRTIIGVAALFTIAPAFIAWVSSVEMAVALMAVIMFAHGFWIANYITAISDIFGTYATSTVVGLSGTAGAISGLMINTLIGLIVQNYSCTLIWIVSGFIYPLASMLFIIFIRRIRPLKFATR